MTQRHANVSVSVYIPTYNRSELLNRAVLSVLDQTMPDFEIIIVDDNSSDETLNVVQALMNQDSRIRYFRNEKNKGACFNRNFAINAARGRFVTGLDDDDYFLPQRLENFIQAWQKKPSNTVALFSNKRVKLQGNILHSLSYPESVDVNGLYIRNDVGNQIFARKETFSDSMKYDEKLTSWQDIDMWINILRSNIGSQFINTHHLDYILDKSHPHERISSTNLAKHLSSCRWISKKYNLTCSQSSQMRCQVYSYNARKVKVGQLVRDAFQARSAYVVLRLIKYYLMNKKSF